MVIFHGEVLNNQMVVIVPTYSNLPYVVATNMAGLGDLFTCQFTGWLWLQLLGIGSEKYITNLIR
jgi:hypothetical protein